ncbi:MAG: YggS family pyridoxal phosphate-dependent enzyme [Lachnospiraceae bacterium]|nr:YggS family pyridoxal phosphate-dependent enzyme [Lachnospiraceae bacterium]
MVKENLMQVRENIKRACEKSGRDPENITLIAVSKTKPVPMLDEAYQAGSRDFGENKVQEIMDKHPALPEDIRWHMIGHLQRNKVKYIVDKVCLIHSVDSLRLAEEISIQSEKKQVETDILIEVNIAQEESKFGVSEKEVLPLIQQIAKLPHIHIKGLMTIAPFVNDPEENRKYFHQIRELSVDIMKKNIDNVSMSVLSMGMTGDYMVAVEEGATMVRVGTGIFGERNYTS